MLQMMYAVYPLFQVLLPGIKVKYNILYNKRFSLMHQIGKYVYAVFMLNDFRSH